jgi:N-acetylmuramoyl-L-alanine amidase
LAIDNGVVVATAIASVQVKVDGVTVGNATYGVLRPDVCAAYPGRVGCPNVGYNYALNTSVLTAGSHVITVSATDTEGNPEIGSTSVTISVASGPPDVYIETPTSGAVINGTTTVGGWAIDSAVSVGTPIASVVIKVDINVVGTASYGISRPDVCAAFPDRPSCPNVGWNYSLDTTKLTGGSHTLTATATDTDGTPLQGSWTVAIQVSPPPLVNIDSPASGSVVSGTINVGGWRELTLC